MFVCDLCQKEFNKKHNLSRHTTSMHSEVKNHKCLTCNRSFSRLDVLKKHEKTHVVPDNGTSQQIEPVSKNTDENSQHVEDCEDDCTTEYSINSSLMKKSFKLNGGLSQDLIPALDAYKVCLVNFQILCLVIHFKMILYFIFIKDKIEKLLIDKLKKHKIKWFICVEVEFTRPTLEKIDLVCSHFHGKCRTALNNLDIAEGMQESYMKIVNSFQEYCRNGSQWKLSKIKTISLNISKYAPIKGGTYISTPVKIHSKKAVINVKNSDDKCFMWAILSALHPVNIHSDRVSQYMKYENILNFRNITFPVKVSDYKNFENVNNIAIMVYKYDCENGVIEPLYFTSLEQRTTDPINLLLLQSGDNYHYVWIKNLNKLLADPRSTNHSKAFCPYCLHGFNKDRNGESNLEKHKPFCLAYGPQRVVLPEEGENILKFTDVAKQQKIPFVVYADFETLNCKIQGCQNEASISSTQLMTKHVPSGFSYQIISDHQVFPLRTFRGVGAAEKFLRDLMKDEQELRKSLKKIEPMRMNEIEKESFRLSSHCHICKKRIEDIDDKVRDHDHISGAYRGAAHISCNLNFKTVDKIPVILHNLKGYDAHIICQAIGNVQTKEPEVIAKNMEDYIFFKIGNLHFMDSLQFLNASLEDLTKNLLEMGVEKFTHLRNYFNTRWKHLQNKEEAYPLLLRKLVYPYSYMDGWERFEEKELPPRSVFYNDLSQKDIAVQDYEHAVKVWEAFQLKNLGELHDLYVEVDTILTADIFQNFRKISLDYYELDPCHFYTAPGLTWSAALKMTGVHLELITDPDMVILIDRGMRGGISQISNRYAKANNQYLEDYDASQKKSYIINMDATNLYGWAMSQVLPTHGFQWYSEENLETLDVSAIEDDAKLGLILEVDLEYPEELHDLHDDYPCAPEKKTISPDMLSAYQKELLSTVGGSSSQTEKLLLTLSDKKNYVIHYRILKLYLSLGNEDFLQKIIYLSHYFQ